MKRYTSWVLALLFYATQLPWAGAAFFNYNAHNMTGDGGNISGFDNGTFTGTLSAPKIGSATDNGYFNDLIVKGPWVDVRAFLPDGYVTDGSVNYGAQLLEAAAYTNANNIPLIFPPGTYLTSSSLSFDNTPYLSGSNTVIEYSGTGSAVVLSGTVDVYHMTFYTPNAAANCIEMTDGTQMNTISDVSCEASLTGGTGKGLYFNAAGAFLYGTDLSRVRSIRYKYPLYAHGANLSDNTVNQITGRNLQLHCYDKSVSGSTGIYFDSGAHGIGSDFIGGSIESCDVGIYVADGSYGLSYRGDIEDVNTAYTLGNQFTGTIEPRTHGEYYRGHKSSGTWFQYKNHEAQDAFYENYYDHSFVSTYGSGGNRNFSYYVGPSLIDGGSPQFVWGVFGEGAAENTYNTYIKLVNRKISFYSETPQNDNVACTVGDIVLNSGSDNVLGWKCTAPTPAWKAMTITLAP